MTESGLARATIPGGAVTVRRAYPPVPVPTRCATTRRLSRVSVFTFDSGPRTETDTRSWASWNPANPDAVAAIGTASIERSTMAVSVDEADSATVMQFVRELGVGFDILQDRAGAIRRLYQTTGVPESFVIERDGVIVKKVIGPAEWDGPVNEVLIRKLIDAR